MVSFLLLAAEKKTPLLVQLQKNFGPSYFVTALAHLNIFVKQLKKPYLLVQVCIYQINFDLLKCLWKLKD